jgi:hypothetical protein
MAVAASATGTAAYSAAASPRTFTFTVNASDTLALFFIVADTAPVITSVTWDSGGTNQACTQVATRACSTATNGTVWIYAVVNPTSGTKTLSVAFTGTVGISAEMQSYTGSVTTSVAAACTNALTGQGTSATASTAAQSGVSGDMYVSAYVSGVINSVSNTSIYLLAPAGNDAAANRAQSTGVGITLTASLTSGQWAAVSCDIKAATTSVTSSWGFGQQENDQTSFRRHPWRNRRSAGMPPKEDGNEAPFINWQNVGNQQESGTVAFRRHPWRNRRVAATSRDKDDGNESPFVAWNNAGWEIQSVQPPVPYGVQSSKWVKLSGATARGDDGSESPFVGWRNFGWEIQSVQPPIPWKIKAASGATARGDDGTEYLRLNFYPAGWEIQAVQPPHRRPERFGAIVPKEDGIEFPFVFTGVVTSNWGFDPQPYQPQRIPRPGAAIARTDDGTQYPLIIFYPHAWPVQPHQPKAFRAPVGGIMPKEDGIESPFVNWFNVGWEIASPMVRRPATRRQVTLLNRNIDGVMSPVTFVTSGWGFDFLPPDLRTYPTVRQRGAGASGESVFAAFSTQPWTDDLFRDLVRVRRLDPASFVSSGTEGVFTSPVTTAVGWGFDAQSYQPQHIRWKAGTIARGDDGNEAPFINWYNAGWEIQPPPPRQFREHRGLIFPREDGNESPFVGWRNFGWEIQPALPRHIFNRQFLQPEDGIQAAFVAPLASTSSWGFDAQSYQPQRIRWRGGTIARGDDGNELPSINWYNAGWEIQSVQPPHRRPEVKSAAFVRIDDGTEAILIRWFNAGWEIQSVQPPHRRPERAGAIAPKDDGIESPFIFIPLPTAAWFPDIDNFLPKSRKTLAAVLISFDLPGVFLPLVPPIPPILPIPPGFGAQKVLSVDTVQNIYPTSRNNLTQVFSPILPSVVNVGDSFALLIESGRTLNSDVTYSVFITKPDGSRWVATSPQVYVAEVDSYVKQGLFPSQTYTALLIPASFVDQHGYWTCFLQAPGYTSSIQRFYIGPPEVLT